LPNWPSVLFKPFWQPLALSKGVADGEAPASIDDQDGAPRA